MQQGRIYKSLSGKILKSNFTDLRIGTRLNEGYGLACSTNFLAFANDGGGGCGTVLSIESAGIRKPPIMIISGHNAGITNISFSPFYNNILATSSDDKTVKIWSLPTSGEYYDILNQNFMESQNINRNEYILNITSPVSTLSGHEKRVYFCEFNHCADNILATASLDNKIVIWDMNKESEVFSISNINCPCYDLKWNYLGTLLVTMNKDKKTRILDPRSESVVSSFITHDGTRIGKCVWLEGPGNNSNKNKILTTGFSRTGMRSIKLWDIRSLSNCLTNIELDIISSTLYPYYQNEFRLLSIFGKGDGNIRLYEFNNESDHLNLVEEFSTTQAQRGCCFLPSRALSIDKSEALRIYKSIGTDTIDVISFSMNRKTHAYNKELFPDCFAGKPSLSAEEWINGSSKSPILISLNPNSLNSQYSPKSSLDFSPNKQLSTSKTKSIISGKDLNSDLEKNSKTSMQRDNISFEKKTDEGLEKRVSKSSILSKLSSVMPFGRKSSLVNITSKRSIYSSNDLNNEETKDSLQSYPDMVSRSQGSNINSSEDVNVTPTSNIDNNTINNFEMNKDLFVSSTHYSCYPIFNKPQVNYGDILDYRADISRTTSYIDNGCMLTHAEYDKPRFPDISIKNNLSLTSYCIDTTSNKSDYSKLVNEIKDFEVSKILTKNLGKESTICGSNLCGATNSVFAPIDESFEFGNEVISLIDTKKQLVSDETNLEFNEDNTDIELKKDQLNMQNPNQIILNITSMLKLDLENVNKRLTQLDNSLKLLNDNSKQYENKQENDINYIEELQHLKEQLAKLNIQYYDLSVAYKQQTALFGLYKEFYAELEDILAESFNSMRATAAER
ncbi:uncharacterized protein CMU_025110 [Cryptosporidium muris RN66]|uniref:Coronin n=1 Tax=Cryptosporidium muris (strain RN66) TaxID=441375 RepID=B6AAV3_CRYMR|nr:uncharacterized protein CMU_025110 [Cryptosporidium muris RN66]EEA05505.1 hypothetical protein, conserved [Cryptosporidium muris RN66]|eukprot:XP_002139854.1 hypothetical protein [Cryptosporidium muris RN66]